MYELLIFIELWYSIKTFIRTYRERVRVEKMGKD